MGRVVVSDYKVKHAHGESNSYSFKYRLADKNEGRYFNRTDLPEIDLPIRNVPITSLEISGPVTLTVGQSGTYTVTALPENNSQMQQIELALPAGLSLNSMNLFGNVLTAVIRPQTAGVMSFSAACGEILDTYYVTATVEIESLSVDGPDTLPIDTTGTFTITAKPD